MTLPNEVELAKALLTHAIQFSESSIKSLDDLITRHQLFLQETQALKQLETDLADSTAGDLKAQEPSSSIVFLNLTTDCYYDDL